MSVCTNIRKWQVCFAGGEQGTHLLGANVSTFDLKLSLQLPEKPEKRCNTVFPESEA